MLHGGEDGDLGMEGAENENGGATARPEADAATARKEAAIQAVAAMSRRVRGGDKATGMVAGYARPAADQLHRLRDVDELRVKSTEAVVQRPGCKVGGLLGLYQQRKSMMNEGTLSKTYAFDEHVGRFNVLEFY